MIQSKLNGLGQLQQYTPAQLAAMSQADLRNLVVQAQTEIDYINSQLSNEYLDPATIAGMQQNLLEYQALVAAINSWLGLSPTQQAQQNGGNYISQQQSSYISAHQNAQQYINQNYQSGNNPVNSLNNILSAQTAGLPTWAWLGIVGAGVYLIAS